MSRVRLTFVGSGDAFGSGGRLQTCMHLESAAAAESAAASAASTRARDPAVDRDDDATVLIDCGTSSLIGMSRLGLDPNRVGVVLLSHLHGDHFGGVPFLVLHGQFNRRTRPLLIAGPAGVRDRLEATMEVFFPGSTKVARRFIVEFVELEERVARRLGPVTVTPYRVEHSSGATPFAVRIECADRVVTYSGDTAWTDTLIEAARDADLFVCEAYLFDRQVRYHLDYRTLERERPRLTCRRIVLTHMSEDMLAHVGDSAFECASDGFVVDV